MLLCNPTQTVTNWLLPCLLLPHSQARDPGHFSTQNKFQETFRKHIWNDWQAFFITVVITSDPFVPELPLTSPLPFVKAFYAGILTNSSYFKILAPYNVGDRVMTAIGLWRSATTAFLVGLTVWNTKILPHSASATAMCTTGFHPLFGERFKIFNSVRVSNLI